jgi:hypothetical protein
MRNDEEAINHPQGQSRHGEEVHRRNGLAVIVQECRPSFCWFRVRWSFPHPSQNGSFRDVKAEHLQLAVNARRTPCRVLCDHAEDQVPQFLANPPSSPAHSMSRQPCPIKLESGSMPSDHSLRLTKHKRPYPSRPEPAQEHPKESVMRTESGPRTPALQYDKLLPQRQIFQEQVATGTEQPTNKSKKGSEQAYHTVSLSCRQRPRHMIHVFDSWADPHFGESQHTVA